MSDKPVKSKRVSIGVLLISCLLAFAAGNRFTVIGDYFFSPYSNNNNQTLSRNLDFAQVEQVYDQLKQHFDGKLDSKALQEGLSKGLVEATGDPYTTYFTAAEAEEFQNDLDGTFSGIGAELGKRDDKLVIIAPVDGSPAQKAGVRAGDGVATIDGKDASQLSVDEAVDKIRGDAGSEVKLGLVRDGNLQEVTIVRSQISVPSVKSEVKDGIGYLTISRFSSDTASLAAQAAQNFKAQNVRGVVVDVRNNGGGLLDSVVKVSGLWLDNKVVVEERQGKKITEQLKSGTNPPLKGIPTKLLINGGSASASEILAGALHDHGAAQLIGEKTFGKGSVQEIVDLKDGAQLKVTVARWFTPNGKNIDKAGIKPDIEVTLTAEDINAARDPQLERAKSEL